MYARIKQTVDSLQGRRAGISPSVDAFCRTYGNDPITEFIISRTVLNPPTDRGYRSYLSIVQA